MQQIAEFLRRQPYCTEVLIVENGSTDRTSEVVEQFAAAHVQADDPFQILLLHSPQGKGAAVRHGMLAAKGDYRVISDADLAVPIEEVTKFLPPALDPRSFAIAIASREAPGAVRNDEPVYRHIMDGSLTFLSAQLRCRASKTPNAALNVLPERLPNWSFRSNGLTGGALMSKCCILLHAAACVWWKSR